MAEEQIASDIIESFNLTSEQRKAVDRVITAYNQCGAAYGAAAYRFGMEDGTSHRQGMAGTPAGRSLCGGIHGCHLLLCPQRRTYC